MTPYRSNLHERIISEAQSAFREKGLRAVKMDDIAHKLGISKRTLYEEFPTKEELIIETFRIAFLQSHDTLKRLAENGASTMDIIIAFYKMHISEDVKVNPVLYTDIDHYPALHKFLQEERDRRAKNTYAFFLRGQEEGFFVKDINLAIAADLSSKFITMLSQMHLHKIYSNDELFRVMIFSFIRAYCTKKGLIAIDEVLLSEQP